MSPTLLLSLIFSLIGAINGGCPSSWVKCADEGGTCYVPWTAKLVTVAYGNDNTWTLQKYTNYGGQSLSFGCSNAAYGDVYPGVGKVCCYYEPVDDATLSNEWQLIGNQQPDTSYYYYTGALRPRIVFYVRYGANNVYTYRYFIGTYIPCNERAFGNLLPGVTKQCYYHATLISLITEYDWRSCGTGGSNCNLQVTGSTSVQRFVRYGVSDTNTLFRQVYSPAGSVPCKPDFFDNLLSSSSTAYCWVSANINKEIFTSVEGSWILAGSCMGCPITNSVSFGTTSTSSTARTTEWTKSLEVTVSSGIEFEGSSSTVSLTNSISSTISQQIQTSYSFAKTQSCAVNCGSNSGNWYLYQWILNVGEYDGLAYKNFGVFACNYVCKNALSLPKCPLGYCVDSNCDTCTCSGCSVNRRLISHYSNSTENNHRDNQDKGEVKVRQMKDTDISSDNTASASDNEVDDNEEDDNLDTIEYNYKYNNDTMCMYDESNYLEVKKTIQELRKCEKACDRHDLCQYAIYDEYFEICTLLSSCNNEIDYISDSHYLVFIEKQNQK